MKEFTGRAGIRSLDTMGQMRHIVNKMDGKAHVQEADCMSGQERRPSSSTGDRCAEDQPRL